MPALQLAGNVRMRTKIRAQAVPTPVNIQAKEGPARRGPGHKGPRRAERGVEIALDADDDDVNEVAHNTTEKFTERDPKYEVAAKCAPKRARRAHTMTALAWAGSIAESK